MSVDARLEAGSSITHKESRGDQASAALGTVCQRWSTGYRPFADESGRAWSDDHLSLSRATTERRRHYTEALLLLHCDFAAPSERS